MLIFCSKSLLPPNTWIYLALEAGRELLPFQAVNQAQVKQIVALQWLWTIQMKQSKILFLAKATSFSF